MREGEEVNSLHSDGGADLSSPRLNAYGIEDVGWCVPRLALKCCRRSRRHFSVAVGKSFLSKEEGR